jgi:lipopolysaccharide biosynthesis glycosyltransferase
MIEAVYSGTRNLYPHMATAAKSLIANSGVERIWFLIEDEEFPHEVPDIVKTIDVSGQRFFPPGGPNMKTQFTYMALLRVCYAKLLPETGKVLQLDVDTVVVDDVGPLWEMDMGEAWFAAVREPARYVNGHRTDYKPWGEGYYNIGVAMFNLDQIRRDRIDDFLIHVLNTEYLRYIDQDAWDKYGNTRCIDLPTRYNESMVTGYTDDPAIIHYAGYGNGWTDPSFRECPRLEHVRKYREMSWGEAMDRHELMMALESARTDGR